MNFFFGFQNEYISSEITVPKFSFDGELISRNYKVFSAEPHSIFWKIERVKIENTKNFYLIKNSEINNEKIFFLSKQEEIENKLINRHELKKLYNFNDFLDDKIVEFRSNLKISIQNKGYSSYQSDYNFNLCKTGGNILSPLNSLLNKNAEINLIIFRNISLEPIKNKSKYYIIDLNAKEILDMGFVTNNTSNEIKICNKFVKDSVFFFTEGIIGIPIFVSLDNGHLSMEHTHPPHHYILSNNRFKIVNSLKDRFRKIVELNAKKFI